MSGRKRSSVEFADPERRRRAALLARVEAARRQIAGLGRQAERVADRAPAAIRDRTGAAEQAARAWRQALAADPAVAAAWDLGHSAAALDDALVRLDRLADAGRDAIRSLEDAVVRHTAVLRNELADRLARLAGTCTARLSLVRRWLGEAREARLNCLLERASRAVQGEDLAAAERELAAAEADWAEAAGAVEQREAEQARREQVQQVVAMGRDVEACRRTLLHRLGGASSGLHETFAPLVEEARRWARTAEQAAAAAEQLASLGADDVQAAAHQITTALDALRAVQSGWRLNERLRKAFHDEASALRAQAEARASAVRVLFDGAEALLRAWSDEAEVGRFRDALAALDGDVRADRFGGVEASCARLETELQDRITRAEEQEARHRRRLYLLKALRQVCRDLGFAEVGPQRYERPGDRRSRIVFAVDTKDRGPVAFFLSLDSIDADSCISKGHCGDEFTRLSARLIQEFGVQTQFEVDDGGPLPLARHSGALDEPQGGAAASAAAAGG